MRKRAEDRRADAWVALADGTRREILELLRRRPHTAGEIADQFELTGATISHHLAVLREGGLVLCERRAQTLIYSLNAAALHEAAKQLMHYAKR